MRVTKAQYVDVAEVEGARVYTFRASTASVDRQGEVIDQAGWELESYRTNPVVLDSHKYDSVYDIVGRSVRAEVLNGALEVDIIFADNDVEELVNKGFLRTVSVGFRSLARRPGQNPGDPVTHTRMELLEVSMVAIPANRDAVRLRSIEKSGRRISKSTAEAIAAAVDALQMIMDDLSALLNDNSPVVTTEEEACKPKPKPKAAVDEDAGDRKPKLYTAEPGVMAALAAFAKEAKHG